MKGLRARAIVLIAFALAFALPAPVDAQSSDPVAVVTTWVKALDTYEFDTAVSLLSEESFVIIVLPQSGDVTIYKGSDEIRRLMESYKPTNTHLRLVGIPRIIHGTVTWTERLSSDNLRRQGLASVDILGEALLSGDKIKSIIYSLTPESAKKVQVVLGTGITPTGMPRTGGDLRWGATRLLILAGLFAISGAILRAVRCDAPPRRSKRS